MLAKKTITAAVAALAVVGLFSLTGCGGGTPSAAPATPVGTGAGATPAPDLKLVTPGTLTVCADVPYPPFEVEDASAPSGYSGFDVDIMQAVAQKLGLQYKVIPVDFTALQSGVTLAAGTCDVGASAITITDARKANIDFSDPYYDSLQSLLVRADSGITDLAGMAGKNLGVQAGTTGKTYAQQNAPSTTKIIDFPSDGQLWPAIQAGQIDGILQDLPVNQVHEKADANYKIVAQYKTNEQYGFAVAKGQRPALLAAINQELATMRSDGTYDQIYKKYFG